MEREGVLEEKKGEEGEKRVEETGKADHVYQPRGRVVDDGPGYTQVQQEHHRVQHPGGGHP